LLAQNFERLKEEVERLKDEIEILEEENNELKKFNELMDEKMRILHELQMGNAPVWTCCGFWLHLFFVVVVVGIGGIEGY
jgi:DNA repair exonuclease SbcCD ATPase subunit